VINKLQAVLNASLKSIIGLRKYDHISSEYQSSEWLTMREKVIFRTACLIYSILNHGRPTYLRHLLQGAAPKSGLIYLMLIKEQITNFSENIMFKCM
jgi:hypothetical protein